jgi:hypothetical protein
MKNIEWDTFITDSKLSRRVQRILLSHGFVQLKDLRNMSMKLASKWRGMGSKCASDLQDFMWKHLNYEIPLINELHENFLYIHRLENSLQTVIIYEDQLDYIINMYKKRIFPRPDLATQE